MATIGDHDLLASQMVIASAPNSRFFDLTFDEESRSIVLASKIMRGTVMIC